MDIRQAMERTHRWAERCLKAKRRADQALFGIVQGGIFPDLRRHSVEFMTGLDFPGYAIGGLAVGETKAEMVQVAFEGAPGQVPIQFLRDVSAEVVWMIDQAAATLLETTEVEQG